MRILILNTQMEAGGAQKALLVLARELKRRGHHVVVAFMYDKEDYISIFNERYGLEVINLHMKLAGGKLTKGKAFAMGLRHLQQIMKRERIEIVQTFSHYSNLIGPIVARTVGVPICVSSQRMSLLGMSKWIRFVDKIVMNSNMVQMMTTVSEGIRDYCIQVEGIKPEKLLTIYSGVDVTRYNIVANSNEKSILFEEIGLPETSVVVTQVARLHPVKGHKYLLQAIPKVISAFPNTHFLLVGDGDYREQIESDARQMGLDAYIHLLGMRQDIPCILSISDLFIMPSLREGMPNAVLEAMAARLPVVASDVEGCPEVVVDGETGILVPTAQPELLGDAILKILQNPDLAARMGQCAQNRVEREFSIERNVSSYEQLYEKLLSDNG